ncbi:hypothetical protein IJ596_00510 [bacterium]|nr:hypothetical protein [bacterium]
MYPSVNFNSIGSLNRYTPSTPNKNRIESNNTLTFAGNEKTPAKETKNNKRNLLLASLALLAVTSVVVIAKARKASRIAKELDAIPQDLKEIFGRLKDKKGKEFIDSACQEMTEYMGLKGIAPKEIKMEGHDGLYCVTGGYSPIEHTISYSPGFLNIEQAEQLGLVAHELTHCRQFTNILRTEGIGVEEYAKAEAECAVKNAIRKDSVWDFMFRSSYKKAVEQGKGEEFLQEAIKRQTEKYISEIEKNFAQVLKLPKIKADSPEGIKAFKDLEAQRNYKGLGFLGSSSDEYKNSPIELEAYTFGNKIAKMFKTFMIYG